MSIIVFKHIILNTAVLLKGVYGYETGSVIVG